MDFEFDVEYLFSDAALLCLAFAFQMCGHERWESHEKILPSLASRPAEPALRSQSTYSINKSKLEQHNRTMELQDMNDDDDDDVDRFGLRIQYEEQSFQRAGAAAGAAAGSSGAVPIGDSGLHLSMRAAAVAPQRGTARTASDEAVGDITAHAHQQQQQHLQHLQRSADGSPYPSSISKVSSQKTRSGRGKSVAGQAYAPSWMSSENGATSRASSDISVPSSNVGSVGNGVVGPMRGMLPAFEYDLDC